jgi:hypothetical protein
VPSRQRNECRKIRREKSKEDLPVNPASFAAIRFFGESELVVGENGRKEMRKLISIFFLLNVDFSE